MLFLSLILIACKKIVMKPRFQIVGLLLILIPALTFGQGSKTLKKKNVVSQTTYEYFLDEGKKDPVVEKIERYDKEGNRTELKVFNRSGELKQWEQYSYDENDDVIEEKYLDEKGRVTERIEYTFEDKLVKEKRYYDARDRMVKKKTYAYEFREEE